jgi:hypothetical protein
MGPSIVSYARYMLGICLAWELMSYARHIPGIYLAYAWHMTLQMPYVRHIPGIYQTYNVLYHMPDMSIL